MLLDNKDNYVDTGDVKVSEREDFDMRTNPSVKIKSFFVIIGLVALFGALCPTVTLASEQCLDTVTTIQAYSVPPPNGQGQYQTVTCGSVECVVTVHYYPEHQVCEGSEGNLECDGRSGTYTIDYGGCNFLGNACNGEPDDHDNFDYLAYIGSCE
jgi:hypothetical protein